MADERAAAREDLRAALEARRELGPEHEQALVDAFLDRVEQSVEQRVAAAGAPARRGGADQRRFVLALLSLGAGVPLTAIALASSGLAALAVGWLGIVLVNVAFGRGR